MIPEYPEVHQQGSLGICNQDEVLAELQKANENDGQVDVGIQVASDGRIWLCVNGFAFLRFKPSMSQMFVPTRESV